MSTAPSTDPVQDKRVVKDYAHKSKLNRLAHHLAVGMSLISGATVRGKVVPHLDVPAATSYNRVARQWRNSKGVDTTGYFLTYFDPMLLPEKDLQVWLGIAWHELGHVLWSPYDSGVSMTIGLNLLEDARIETLIIHKYPKMKAALMAALYNMISQGEAGRDPTYEYAWVAGRAHLSRDVRNKARSLLEKHMDNVVMNLNGRQVADKVDTIFKEYVGMGSNLNLERAIELSHELNQLLGEGASGKLRCKGMTSGEGESDTPDVDIPDDTVEDIGSDSSDTDEGSGDGADEGESTDTGSGGSSSEDKIEPIEDPDAEQRDYDRRSVIRDLKNEVEKELAKEASDVSKELMDELAKIEKVIDYGAGREGVEVDVKVESPHPSVQSLASEVRRVALKFNDESGKGLVRRRDHGRFKPGRFERYDDLDTAYDQWEPGLEQEMNIFILMDASGSMDRHQVSKVLYALEMGLRDVATVEVVLFNTSVMVPAVKNSDTRYVNIPCGGGTDPSDSLSYIHPRILRSSAANRLLVMYTDGVFSDPNSYGITDSYIGDLIRNGVSVEVLADPRANLEHMSDQLNNVTIGRNLRSIPTVTDLPKVVLEWTKTVLSKGGIL